jgi:two-component system NarL family response regulator
VAARCRRAVSAEHELDVVDSIDRLPAKLAPAPAVVILDSAVLAPPIDQAAGEIVGMAGAAGRVIVMTPVFDEEEEIALLKAGVKGCCRRGIDPESLQQVLTVTHNGGVWVTRSLVPRLVAELRRYAQAPKVSPAKKPEDKLKSLTRRERDIVRLIVGGASNKEVAQALDISERTVKGHLSNVFQKLGVADRLKLVLYLNEGNLALASSTRRS